MRQDGEMSLLYFNKAPALEESDDDGPEEPPTPGGTKVPRGEERYIVNVRVLQMVDWFYEVLEFFDSVGADFTPSHFVTHDGKTPSSGVYGIIENIFWGEKHCNPKSVMGRWLEQNFFQFIPYDLRDQKDGKPGIHKPTPVKPTLKDRQWHKVRGLWINAKTKYGSGLYFNRVKDQFGKTGWLAYFNQNGALINSFKDFIDGKQTDDNPPPKKTCPAWDATECNLLDDKRDEAEFYHLAMTYEDIIRPWAVHRGAGFFKPRQIGTVDDLDRLFQRRYGDDGYLSTSAELTELQLLELKRLNSKEGYLSSTLSRVGLRSMPEEKAKN